MFLAAAAIIACPVFELPVRLITGTSGESITTSVTISGAMSGPAGTTVEVYNGSRPLGATLGSNGAWTYIGNFTAGTYSINARATDLAGNVGRSSNLVLTVMNPASADPDTVVLNLSEDAYLGNAQFTVAVDGEQVGGIGTVTALHGSGQTAAFTFNGNFSAGSHIVAVDFLNDEYASTPQTDRNLYVNSITLDGATTVETAVQYSKGIANYAIVRPAAPDTLTLSLSEDACQGNADLTVSVDGKRFGGTQSITALHGQGQSEDLTFEGTFGAGPHTVAIDFLNDLWGGPNTTNEDRNLYVNAITLDGVTTPQNAAQMSQGTASYTVVTPAQPTDTLVLNLSEDAYLGNAQFTVTVDGKQVGGAETLTALHEEGQTQDFTFTGSFGAGPHTVALDFLNDAYAGTPQTDRNLYVNSITLDGATTVENAVQYSKGIATYSISTPTVTGGTSGDDTLTGMSSTNLMVGNGGSDTYVMRASDKTDTIVNGAGSSITAAGKLELPFSHGQLRFEQYGNDLVVDVLGTNQQTVIKNWYNGGQQLAEIVSSDELKLDTGLPNLVQAMAT
ncbi:carbohydrate-binding domain-containing protein [Rhodopila sp.]|uniref:carbohydrate-binding domain-containing protein n=1 Tax=Rhodopila sp. TaxID=2480087 RepID=UPI003D14D71B